MHTHFDKARLLRCLVEPIRLGSCVIQPLLSKSQIRKSLTEDPKHGNMVFWTRWNYFDCEERTSGYRGAGDIFGVLPGERLKFGETAEILRRGRVCVVLGTMYHVVARLFVYTPAIKCVSEQVSRLVWSNPFLVTSHWMCFVPI